MGADAYKIIMITSAINYDYCYEQCCPLLFGDE